MIFFFVCIFFFIILSNSYHRQLHILYIRSFYNMYVYLRYIIVRLADLIGFLALSSYSNMYSIYIVIYIYNICIDRSPAKQNQKQKQKSRVRCFNLEMAKDLHLFEMIKKHLQTIIVVGLRNQLINYHNLY